MIDLRPQSNPRFEGPSGASLMELRQLRYFLSLANTLNFTRAAAEVNIAQPPFSRQIRQLEAEIGTPLIDREAKPLTLTPAGELFCERAVEILGRVDLLRKDAQTLGRTGQQPVRIGVETTVLYSRFPELLRELREANPGLRIDLVELVPDGLIGNLREGKIDIGFGRMRVAEPDVAQMLVREEPLFVALPVRHSLAEAAPAPLQLRDLLEQTLILYPAGEPPHLPSSLHALFTTRGLRPKDVIEASELQVALGLVAADYGICIVPAVVQRMRSDVCYRQLDEPGLTSPFLISWRKDDRPELVSSINELLGRILQHAPQFAAD